MSLFGIGETIAAGIEATASHINSALSWMANKDIASDNYDYSKGLASYQNAMNINNLKIAPSAQVEGLRKAGINPVTAYGNLANIQTQVPVFNGAKAPQLDSGLGAIAELFRRWERNRSDLESAKKQREVMQSEQDLNEANKRLVEARTEKERSTTTTSTLETELKEATIRKLIAEAHASIFSSYAGLKSQVRVQSSGLAKWIGVEIGQTVALGDIIALSIVGATPPEKLRDMLRENAIKNGVDDPVRKARDAERSSVVRNEAATVVEEAKKVPTLLPPPKSSARDVNSLRPGQSYFREQLFKMKRRKEAEKFLLERDPSYRVRRFNPSFKNF